MLKATSDPNLLQELWAAGRNAHRCRCARGGVSVLVATEETSHLSYQGNGRLINAMLMPKVDECLKNEFRG
jgi:hypothetical protein